MSYVDELVAAYGATVSLPWPQNLSRPERVWMAVYPPEHERRLRLHLPAFETETTSHHHPWGSIDITRSFESWMAGHDYRDEYFEDPELLDTALPAFLDHLIDDVRAELHRLAAPDGVVALIGAGTLFGLGETVKVSALLNGINDSISGRLLVFFPGEVENDNYRLLDARDGWDYRAMVIKPNGRTR